MEILLNIALILLFAKIFEVPFRKYGFSPITAYVIAGFIIGPYMLGLITSYEGLIGIANLSLILLMLYTGLTTDFRDLTENFRYIVLIGVSGVAITFTIIYVFLHILGFNTIVALFVAFSLSNTATETVAAIISRESAPKLRAIIVGASFIDDLIAVFLVTFLTSFGYRQDISLYELMFFILKITAFLITTLYISHVLTKKYSIVYQKLARDYFWFASAIITISLLLAIMARLMGLSELIGAYIAGLIFARSREFHDPMLKPRIALTNFLSDFTMFLNAIFVPIFFVYIGLSYSLGEVDIPLYVSLLSLAIMGKFIAVYPYAYKIFKNTQTAMAVGFAMGSRGSLEVVLLKLGLETGVISHIVFSTVLTVALTTTIISPLLFTTVYKRRIIS